MSTPSGCGSTDTSGDSETARQDTRSQSRADRLDLVHARLAAPARHGHAHRDAADENGSVAGFAWDLDSDGAFDDGSSAQVTRSFPTPGNYPVALRLTDNDGASTVVEAVVRVGKGGKTR